MTSTFTYVPMYNLLFLHCSFVFLITIVCFALCEDVECSNWDYTIFPWRAPHTSDCRYILSHMPDIRPLSSAQDTLSIANPFFPSAQFIHGSCSITVELIDRTPTVDRMRKAIALQGWFLVNVAAAKIIAQCVDNRQPGAFSGYVDDTDQVYAVVVERNGWYPVWTYGRWRDMDDRAVNKDHPQYMGYHNGLFRRTIYHV